MLAPRQGFGPFAALARLVALAAALISCGGEVVGVSSPISSTDSTTQPAQTSIMQTLWRRSVRQVVIEVDYGPGAAPFVGSVPGVRDLWGIFRSNAQRLFEGSGKTLAIPTTLGQMQRIDTDAEEFTLADLVALARRNRTTLSTGDTAAFYVMMLNGYFRDASGQRRTDLLGGHLDGTGIIVVFKPVVLGTAASGGAYAPAIVEQMTLVHEFGHAVGLVDDGVAPVRDHADHARVHHCTSTSCVMNAWNEGGAAATAFATRISQTGDAILFDADCLADAAAAIAAAR